MSDKLQMSLKTEWFEMTKAGIKIEDYREITPYWMKRLVHSCSCLPYYKPHELNIAIEECPLGGFKEFKSNTMTLGYPKKGDTERIIEFEHAGIEIRTGNPAWGAESGKLYFVIKHGNRL